MKSDYVTNSLFDTSEAQGPNSIGVYLLDDFQRFFFVKYIWENILTTPHWLNFLFWSIIFSNFLKVDLIFAKLLWKSKLMLQIKWNLIDINLLFFLSKDISQLHLKFIEICLMEFFLLGLSIKFLSVCSSLRCHFLLIFILLVELSVDQRLSHL